MHKRMTMRLMAVYLSFILLCMLVNMAFPMMHTTGQYHTHVMPVSTVDTFREPFKDFFDYEWWLQGSEYAGKGNQYGKWFVIETFWNGNPRQRFYITKENLITGTDSARMEIDGSANDVRTFGWRGVWGPYEPDQLPWRELLNPAYLRFRFRIDEWITYRPDWRVTLGAIGGAGPGMSALEGQVIIGLQANPLADPDNLSLPPCLRLHYRIGDSFDWWTDPLTVKIVSEQEVSIGEVHTLEIMRIADSVNGVVAVWLDGVEVADLRAEDIVTSFPGGVQTVFLGSGVAAENGFFSLGQSAGSSCVITFDDLRLRDEYIGPDPLPITYYDLTLDSSPQVKTVCVGNHVLEVPTPVTIQVPEGTVPKVGVAPTNFDHWEISPEVPGFPISDWEELWPDLGLMATVTRVPAQHDPGGVGPSPTPAIYQDTRITAMYTTGIKHTLNITSDPVTTSFTVDELDYTTPWSDQLTEGTHTIAVPSTFTVGENIYNFKKWEDDSTNLTRTVNLVSDMYIAAYYDVTIIPEFPTLIAWLAVFGVISLTIVLGARKLRERSTHHRHFHSE